MDSLRIIIVSEVDFLAGRDLSTASVLTSEDRTQTTYWEQASESHHEVARLLRKDSLVCIYLSTIELDGDVRQSVAVV